MTDHFGALSLGLAILGTTIVGCATPYTYYCDEAAGPHDLSGRYGDVGCDGGVPCDEPAVGMYEELPGDCGGCAPCAGGPFGGHTVTSKLRNMLTCNAGCGRVYWGEWSYDPPDACDPCNNHGDWIGPRCCPPRGWVKIWQGLRGERCCPVPCASGCASDCAAPCGGCADQGDMILEGNTMGTFDPALESIESVADPAPDTMFPDTMFPATPDVGSHPHVGRDPNSRLIRRTMR